VTLGNDNGTDGQTDGQTVRRNMRPPPMEEGRIIIRVVQMRCTTTTHITAYNKGRPVDDRPYIYTYIHVFIDACQNASRINR